MKRISRRLGDAADSYTAVVIGSGYGGSIAASRLARAGQRVCLLERGPERVPGEYPNTLGDISSDVQIDTVHGHYGSSRAMFDVHMNDDITAVVGCGLGGTSLINANVSLEIDRDLFDHDAWPQVFKQDHTLLEPYYDRARTMLDPSPYPEHYPQLNKLQALEMSAKAIGADFYRPPINVNFRNQVNRFGVYQSACNNCGDCCSGCNYGAKNTTLMNYLPDAVNHGAEIFTESSVRWIERVGDRWAVHCQSVPDDGSPLTGGVVGDTHAEPVEPPLQRTIMADIVVLGAGTLGSTEILARSKANGLALSHSLGQGFSGNGDVLAFGYDNLWRTEPDADGKAVPVSINGIGQGTTRIPASKMPGPCITGIIDERHSGPIEDRLVVEEGVIPGALAAVIPLGYFGASAIGGNPFAYGPKMVQERLEAASTLGNTIQHNPGALADDAYVGPVSRSQTYLMMSHDDADGVLRLSDDDRLRIEWPGAGREAVFDHDNDTIRKVNAAIKGELLTDPMWSEAMGRQLVTVHPVGGCRMADDWQDGVVDDRCRVFSGAGTVHDGLFVCDGAVMPGAVGVNPLLTISAVAERAMELLIHERGWTANATLAEPRPGKVPFAGARPGRPGQWIGKNVMGWIAAVLRSIWAVIMHLLGSVWKFVRGRIADLIRRIVMPIVKRNPDRYAPAMHFTETMEGWISTELPDTSEGHIPARERVSNEFELAVARGIDAGTPIDFLLTLATDDLWTLTTAADRPATATGTVTCAALSATPMHVRDGRFHLLPPDADRVETWLMTYDLTLDRDDATPLHFIGHKYLHRVDDTSNPWTDLTKLFVTVTDATTDQLVARGIMTLDLQDFVRQSSTVVVTPVRTGVAKFKPIGNAIEKYFLAQFAAGLGKTVLHAYGGVLADLNNFAAQDNSPGGKPRQRRPLTAPPPQEFPIRTADGATVKLTRYQGGPKGPVILSPGFSVRADSFAIDTVDENLVEYLCAADYDVWLFAYRGSPDSGSSTTPFTIDDIATYDWPAAIEHVRIASGRDVQVMAHCVASMTLLMALLDGMPGVRNVISSQLTVHPVSNWLNDFKADIDLVSVIEKFHDDSVGIDLRTKIDLRSVVLPPHPTKQDMGAKTLDAALWLVPTPEGEACTNPVCRRVFSLFGPSYTHAQLGFATHEAMEEMFGEIATKPFEQLSTIVRAGCVVDASGKDRYLPHVERLRLPIDFVAGAENQIFLPETSQRTLDWLVANNGAEWYTRHVFADYAHMDLWIGRTANRDVFPYILERLDRHP